MIQKPLFVFCIIFLFAGAVSAQRTVTNADLEQYKQKRLQADKDYRENYERLGMPSPEELEKRREASRAETAKLYDKLRTERLEAAKLSTMEAAANAQIVQSTQFVPVAVPYGVPGGYVFYPNGRFARSNRFRGVTQGYFAGGQFWPTGSLTKPGPILRIGSSGRSIHGIRR